MTHQSLRKPRSLQKPARSNVRNLPTPGSVSGMGPLRVPNRLGIKGIPSASAGHSTRSMFTPQTTLRGLREKFIPSRGSHLKSRGGQSFGRRPKSMTQEDRSRRRSIPIDSDSRTPYPINSQRAMGPAWKVIVWNIVKEIIGEEIGGD